RRRTAEDDDRDQGDQRGREPCRGQRGGARRGPHRDRRPRSASPATATITTTPASHHTGAGTPPPSASSAGSPESLSATDPVPTANATVPVTGCPSAETTR